MSDKHNILQTLVDCGIIPVVRAQSSDQALPVVDAIRKGAIHSIEITMTVPGAIELMKKMSERLGEEVLLGAGTVLDAQTARSCILAGAKFVVGPSLNQEIIQLCRRYSIVAIPGAMTSTEILTA